MKKVDAKKYRTMGELAREIELIFSKCVHLSFEIETS